MNDLGNKTYNKFKAIWDRVDDCVDGQDAIKAGGTKYLPMTPGMTYTRDSATIYSDYLHRAVYYNMTGRTLDSMLSIITSKPAIVSVPAGMDEYLSNVDGMGMTLNNFSIMLLSEVIKKNFGGVLVDWNNNRPILKYYPAQSILDWLENENGILYVKLLEKVNEYDGEQTQELIQIRILKIIEGMAAWQLWRKQEVSGNEVKWVMVEENDFLLDGETMPNIPFVFTTDAGNTTEVNYSLLNDVASINLAHYINSADLENLLNTIGQPMIWESGLSPNIRTPQGYIPTGTGVVWSLDPGGQCGYLEHSGVSSEALRTAMQDKVSTIASIGARILAAERREAESAEAQGIRSSGEQAILTMIANNVSDTITEMLNLMARWSGIPEECVYKLVPNIGVTTLGAERLKFLLEATLAGLYSEKDLYNEYLKNELIPSDKSFEQWRAELA